VADEQSARHKHFSIADLEWMVMPPLLLNQYRLFHDKDRPVGCALWAFVSEDAEAKLDMPIPRLRPNEWKSGDNCWLVDLIAPGAALDNKTAVSMIADLQRMALQGQTISCHRIDPKTGAKQKVVIPAAGGIDKCR
jgi:cytolysin-activating lysine-acyltransferase